MADSNAVESGKQPIGSQTQDAGDATLARGAAGFTDGAHPEQGLKGHSDVEERRETQQVTRPTSDGQGEGLVKDRS